MEKQIAELKKLVEAQDRQIRELKNAITKINKQLQVTVKRSARQDHTIRSHTNMINTVLKALGRK